MMLVGNNTSSKLSLTTENLQLDTVSTPTVYNARTRDVGKSFDSIDDAAKIDNRSSIIYNGVRANTAIEYVLQGNDLKENIIVNAPCENYEYQFQMNLVGLRAELENNGSIKLYDLQTGQSQYVIPAPYMYDDAGKYSTAVSYELVSVKDGIYLLNVIADETWINSSDRAFPVTIDPTITLDKVVWDSYTHYSYPDENYGYDEDLWVSNYRTSYIYMDIPDLPDGATFNRAFLYVYYYYYVTEGSLLAGAYQVLEDWNEGSITYNDAPAVSFTRLDTDILTASASITESSPGLACFIITDAVSDWYADSSSNFGIAIERESSTTYTNGSVILKSYEADDDYAYISVNYTYYVPDGVYALQNDGSTTRWMTVENDSVWEGDHIQQVYSASSPASTSVFDRSSLFKISRVSGTSRYIIRSMLNNNMSFGISGTEVITKKIPSADSDVTAADTFYIEWDGYGFLIQPYGSSNVIKMASTSTANLTTVAETGASSYARWNLVQYTGTNRQGTVLYHPSSWSSVGHIAGTTGSATLVGWSTYINANTLSMDIASGYEDLGTLVWNSSNNQITLSASNPGQIRLNGRIKYANGTQSHQGYFNFTIVPQEGTYYIQNASTGKYIDIEGPSKNAGAIIQQWQFHTGNQEKWNIEHVANSGGYVRLKSVYSNLYIGVDSSNTSSIKQYGTQNDYTLWKIDRSTSGNLVFRCKATETSGVVLSVPLTANSNGTNLTQITYSDDSNSRDEWCLYRLSGYTVNVSVLYDIAYSNRHNDAYSRINAQILKLQEKYMQDIGIMVNDVSLTSFSSYADTYCTTNHTVECSHTSETCRNSVLYTSGSTKLYSLHHTNIFNIMLRIPFPDLSSTVKVAYIGHEYCTETNHTGHPYYGLTYESIGLATIMNFSSETSETKTFIHEFGHFYGVEDHYGGSAKTTAQIIAATGNTGYSQYCIYGERKESTSVLNDFTICDGCKTTLRNNMSRFDH